MLKNIKTEEGKGREKGLHIIYIYAREKGKMKEKRGWRRKKRIEREGRFVEKNPLPHGEAFIITQGERERKGGKRGM